MIKALFVQANRACFLIGGHLSLTWRKIIVILSFV